MSNSTQYDKTSADAIAIAFDYQYYYFLYKLFSLQSGQSVGLEVKDDVHSELENDIQILVQVKHSVRKTATGNVVNLTTLDIDLWHTLYNWCEVITDSEDGRININEQVDFLKKTYFVLVTNKSSTDNNTFIKLLDEFNTASSNFTTLKTKIHDITTDNQDIIKYKAKLLSLDDNVLEQFLQNIEFNLNEINLIDKCKEALKSAMIPAESIDELFRNLDSDIRKTNFRTVTDNKKIIINFDEYYKQYRIYYDQARNTNLQIKKFNIKLPDNLLEQNFIQHLIDIDDISEDDIDDIIEFTKFKLQIQNNINSWLSESELTIDQLEDFEKEVIAIWRNEFRSKNRRPLSEEGIQEKALLIVDSLRKEKLVISSLELDTQHSNGEFYHLSDNLKIGWRKDWEERYSNE